MTQFAGKEGKLQRSTLTGMVVERGSFARIEEYVEA